MKIVVLDGYTLNPGDLSWEGLDKIGDLTVYERTAADEIVERSVKAEILFTNKTPLTGEIFGKLPRLKYVGVLATGYNIIDARAAAEYGIVVTNIPAYGTDSVAQMTFALLLELCLHVQKHSDSVKRANGLNPVTSATGIIRLLNLPERQWALSGLGTSAGKWLI
jgi:glycerate dehydrogenase